MSYSKLFDVWKPYEDEDKDDGDVVIPEPTY